jgi:N-acetylmuramoyl-L-alanine amidase
MLVLGFLLSATSLADTKRTVICLDPGHPSEVGSGTKGKHFTEVHVVWVVAQLLKAKLEADGYQVVLTKPAEDTMVRNRERAEIANRAHAHLLLRLHCDAEGGSGFATYYPSRAGKVNGKSGPSKWVIQASRARGKVFHAAVIKALDGALADRGLLTDLHTAIGAKQGALTGSIYSQVPVLLVEMLVLANPEDEALLRDGSGFGTLAEALRAGVHAAVPIAARP